MLVLTRKRSEMIQIGDNIVLKVIRTGANSVKIGIDAPADVRVLRSELCDIPKADKTVAQSDTTEDSSEGPTPADIIGLGKPDMGLNVKTYSDQYPHPFIA